MKRIHAHPDRRSNIKRRRIKIYSQSKITTDVIMFKILPFMCRMSIIKVANLSIHFKQYILNTKDIRDVYLEELFMLYHKSSWRCKNTWILKEKSRIYKSISNKDRINYMVKIYDIDEYLSNSTSQKRHFELMCKRVELLIDMNK